MADFFWFSDTQWARIELLLPTDVRDKPRVDDRRVLSGIASMPFAAAAVGPTAPMSMAEEDAFITGLTEVARKLNLSPATVLRQIRTGISSLPSNIAKVPLGLSNDAISKVRI